MDWTVIEKNTQKTAQRRDKVTGKTKHDLIIQYEIRPKEIFYHLSSDLPPFCSCSQMRAGLMFDEMLLLRYKDENSEKY